MKFDITRAWKDEAYRQTLSEEQLNTLPANPAGELGDAEMAAVCGGGGEDIGGNWAGIGASSAASSNSRHTHSFSLLCDINVFSLDKAKVIDVDGLLNIANCHKQLCANQE